MASTSATSTVGQKQPTFAIGGRVVMDLQETSVDTIDRLLISNTVSMDLNTFSKILDAKLAYLNKGEDPVGAEHVRPEVARSWIRSYESGVDAETEKLSLKISDEKYDQIFRQYEKLIEIAQPLFSIIEDLDLTEDYIFELINADGISLFQTGNLDLHQFVAPQSSFDEASMGTNAHSLCMRHKASIQILGPEHYCFALHDLAASAAPILNDQGVAIASLLLTQPLHKESWSKDHVKLLSHTLGLIASLASAIEYQVKFQHSRYVLLDFKDKITTAATSSLRNIHLLETAIYATKDGIIVLDTKGKIQHLTPEAGHLLKVSPNEVTGKPVADVLHLIWPDDFTSVVNVKKGKTINIDGHLYTMKVTMVSDKKSGECEGYVIRLFEADTTVDETKKINAGDVAPITFNDILGASPVVLKTINQAKRFALTSENILLTGESGTGKEYFAQAIHNVSCPDGPFMSINCAGIPPRLIESELFGYESGSFTGAKAGGKPGKIELAQGGTLFLDEIGDMPLELQATLLRVLENKRVMRIGGKSYKQIDFRVIAATNRDLTLMAKEKTFREDLLYRLSILTIHLPPLRERFEDKLFFAKYFLNECCRKSGEGPCDISPEVAEIIEAYSWPGNVRELKNAIFSAYYTALDNVIRPKDLPRYILDRVDAARNARVSDVMPRGDITFASEDTPLMTLQQMEQAAIKTALERSDNNVAEAAEQLGISKATLYRKIKDFQ